MFGHDAPLISGQIGGSARSAAGPDLLGLLGPLHVAVGEGRKRPAVSVEVGPILLVVVVVAAGTFLLLLLRPTRWVAPNRQVGHVNPVGGPRREEGQGDPSLVASVGTGTGRRLCMCIATAASASACTVVAPRQDGTGRPGHGHHGILVGGQGPAAASAGDRRGIERHRGVADRQGVRIALHAALRGGRRRRCGSGLLLVGIRGRRGGGAGRCGEEDLLEHGRGQGQGRPVEEGEALPPGGAHGRDR